MLEYVQGSSLRSGLQKLASIKNVSGRLRAAIALQAARGTIQSMGRFYNHSLGSDPPHGYGTVYELKDMWIAKGACNSLR